MKRSEAILAVQDFAHKVSKGDVNLTHEEAEEFLTELESIGMKPPRVDEDKQQALMQVYYAGYTFHQWDEDFEKDEKVMQAYNKRKSKKQ